MDDTTTAAFRKGKALLRDLPTYGDAHVYSLGKKDIEALRAYGFDPVSVGHGLYVCWEPAPKEEQGVQNA